MKLTFWRRPAREPLPLIDEADVVIPDDPGWLFQPATSPHSDGYLTRSHLEQALDWMLHIAGAALEDEHDTRAALAEVAHERDELQDALDERRPVPDRYQLGLVLQQQYFRWFTDERNTYEAWACVADHAIDSIRGLWPTTPPSKPLPPGVVGLIDNEANRLLVETVVETVYELLAQSSFGGGEGAAAGDSTAAATGDPAPDDPTAREAEADRVRDELGALIAARDIELTGGSWPAMHQTLRDAYLDTADTIINAGWRPPLPEVAW